VKGTGWEGWPDSGKPEPAEQELGTRSRIMIMIMIISRRIIIISTLLIMIMILRRTVTLNLLIPNVP
jgi:hypothetical protein